MSQAMEIHEVSRLSPEDAKMLSRLLVETVADGASIGFLPPLPFDGAHDYWLQVFAPGVQLWVAKQNGMIVGTVQLHLVVKQNGRHRAEIAKLMVHPDYRKIGIARALMSAAEDAARLAKRSLLVLDTRANDPSNGLYRSLGYEEAGRIPQYAMSATGQLDTSVFYYKLL